MSVQPDHREVAERRPMTIAQVSALLGIPVPTIRSWERRYGFPTPSRTRGRHRRYTTIEAEQLRDLRDEITRGRSARHAVDLIRRAAEVSPTRSRFSEDLIDASMGLDPHCHPKRARQRRRTAGDRSHDHRCVVAHHEGARSPMEGRRLRDRQRARCDRGGARVVGTPALVRSAALARSAGDGMWARRSAQRRPRSIRRDLGASWMVVLLAGADDARRDDGVGDQHDARRGRRHRFQRNLSRRGAVGSIEAVDEIPGVRAFYAGGAFVSERNRRGVPGIYLGEDVVEAAGIIEAALEAVGGGAASRRSSMSREPARHEAGTR